MNWIGGATARVRAQNKNVGVGGFYPSRHQQGGGQYRGRGESGDGNPGNNSTSAVRHGDVDQDSYRLVNRSEEGRKRTVPLFEYVKEHFPNGDVLALQLSHQMNIDINVPRPRQRASRMSQISQNSKTATPYSRDRERPSSSVTSHQSSSPPAQGIGYGSQRRFPHNFPEHAEEVDKRYQTFASALGIAAEPDQVPQGGLQPAATFFTSPTRQSGVAVSNLPAVTLPVSNTTPASVISSSVDVPGTPLQSQTINTPLQSQTINTPLNISVTSSPEDNVDLTSSQSQTITTPLNVSVTSSSEDIPDMPSSQSQTITTPLNISVTSSSVDIPDKPSSRSQTVTTPLNISVTSSSADTPYKPSSRSQTITTPLKPGMPPITVNPQPPLAGSTVSPLKAQISPQLSATSVSSESARINLQSSIGQASPTWTNDSQQQPFESPPTGCFQPQPQAYDPYNQSPAAVYTPNQQQKSPFPCVPLSNPKKANSTPTPEANTNFVGIVDNTDQPSPISNQ